MVAVCCLTCRETPVRLGQPAKIRDAPAIGYAAVRQVSCNHHISPRTCSSPIMTSSQMPIATNSITITAPSFFIVVVMCPLYIGY